MKSKILALSQNEEFKNLLKKKKISNMYVTIFYGILDNKNKKKWRQGNRPGNNSFKSFRNGRIEWGAASIFR